MTDPWIDQLTAAGWRPGRDVGIEDAVTAYAAAGYDTWPELLAFLTEHDRLEFWSATSERQNPLRLDAVGATRSMDLEETLECEQLAGTTLAPIGMYTAMTFYLGRDGAFYGVYGDTFGLIGDTLREVVDGTINSTIPRPLDLRLPTT